MLFNVEKALGLPDIRHIVSKREQVLTRFGPIFRDPQRLTRQDYLDFLSFKHNCHWTGLERLGRQAADDMDTLKEAITLLVDESKPILERYDTTVSMVRGAGAATLTPILLLAYPDRYGVWNGTSEPEMRDRGVWPTFTSGASDGQKYEAINSVLIQLARDLNVDLWTLDALWWLSKLERQNTGHYLGSRDIEIWKMAEQANQTAKQSYGQKVERTIKNKDLRLSKEDLIKHLKEFLEETGDRCAISGILLHYDGPDPQLRPSLDRIDSAGHYEAGNLQVVARFINFWKSDTDDSEFRRLLAIVRGES